MNTSGRKSLNGRLLRLFLGVQLLVAIATLGAVVLVNMKHEKQRLAEIETQVQEGIITRANVMVNSHALAMRGLVLDLAFTDMQSLVEHAVARDKEVVYGVLMSAEGKPWAYSSPSLRTGKPDGFLKHHKELKLPEGSWTKNKPQQRRVEAFGQGIIEVSRPLVDDGEVLGVIYYGFSTESLTRALAQVRAESRSALESTLWLITLAVLVTTLIGFVLVSRASAHIVRPLGTLTEAAGSIASGTKGVRVQVETNDELEVLSSAFNQMQQANEDAVEQLSRAMEAALEAARLKGEFLANMSHEIRTPMNGIIGVSKLILQMPLEGKLRRYAETVETSANSLMTIINDILDFSKMEAGKYALQSVNFDPSVLLQEVAELQASRAWERGIELVYRRSPDVPQLVTGDPDRYRQIVNNLVGNAVKFTDQGEVFFEMSVDEQAGNKVLLRTVVQDTGVGISEEAQAGLFDAFSQVDGSSMRQHGGTGLGLAISKRLVELMGGKIGVKSEPGVGSTFWFTIAVEIAEVSNQPAVQRFPEGRRALVVEANRRWARIIQEHMLAWGMNCDVMQDGLPALDALKSMSNKAPYDVAVIGAQLRDISIESFVKQLRALPTAKRLPLIVLTQLGANATLSEVEREVAAQVAKPLRLSELYNCIVRVFSGTRTSGGPPRMLPRTPKTGRGRLLIVDDNETNQFVAVEQAEQAGFEADVASNGKEAVEMVKAGRYAAVLMDCQMPIMDGYTATRVIREWEGDRLHTLIIALTAHAMVGERDKVLAAGMDDYLSKPLKPHILDNMLERHLGAGVAPPPTAASRSEPPETELDPDLSRSPKLCSLFITHTPATLKDLDAALAASDAKEARLSAHKLKGSCLALGAGIMASTAAQAQKACEADDLDLARELAAELHEQLARVIELLEQELGGIHPASHEGNGSPPPSAEVIA